MLCRLLWELLLGRYLFNGSCSSYTVIMYTMCTNDDDDDDDDSDDNYTPINIFEITVWKNLVCRKFSILWMTSLSQSVCLLHIHPYIYVYKYSKGKPYFHFLCYIETHRYEENSSNSRMEGHQITLRLQGPMSEAKLCLRAHEWHLSSLRVFISQTLLIFSQSLLTPPDLPLSVAPSLMVTRDIIPRGGVEDDN